jgi:hypothetical protein
MVARMEITNLEIPLDSIRERGHYSIMPGVGGHEFSLMISVKVVPPSFGVSLFANQADIACPELQWLEKIDWFENAGGPEQWNFRGTTERDMYEFQPGSNTFRSWTSGRYAVARDPLNAPPPKLASLNGDPDIKAWIARHGFEWDVPIVDTPAMGLSQGSGGGGGASLLVGNSRRRVIYFDLGFDGVSQRAKAVQILETYQGRLTIQKFIRGDVPSFSVNNEDTLRRWRFETKHISVQV